MSGTTILKNKSNRYVMSFLKYLLLSAVWIGSSYASKSQTTNRQMFSTTPLHFVLDSSGRMVFGNDTICLPITQAKKVLADAYKFRYTDSLLRIVERQLSEKQEEIKLLEEKGQEVSNNHRREVVNLEGQIATLKDQANGFEKMWRKERRRRRLAQAGGAVVAGLAIYLSTK